MNSLGHLPEVYLAGIRDRMLSKVTWTNEKGCWIWGGSGSGGRYGRIHLYMEAGQAVTESAHRTSYMLHRGDIPFEMHVLHSCDVSLCINPEHLGVGTHSQNMREAYDRGRQPERINGTCPKKPYCKNGHDRSEENIRLYTDKRGFTLRQCVPCKQAYDRIRWAKLSTRETIGS